MDAIKLHNTPDLIRAYIHNWLTHEKQAKKMTDVELALLEDIETLIGVAISVMEPLPQDAAGKQ